jgi:hypothetical protein
MAIVYKLAGEVVPAGYLPAMEIKTRQGLDKFAVEIFCNGPFSDAQAAACLMGQSVIISHSVSGGYIAYTGKIDGFSRHTGYSRALIKDAVAAFVAT